MDIIYSKNNEQDILELDRAWASPETFVFLSQRSGVSEDWVSAAVKSFPPEFQTGHFALLTSGSTGANKLVVGSRPRAEALVHEIHRLQENEPAQETVLALPLTYCFSFVNQWLWARTLNRRFIYTHGFSSPDILREALNKAQNAMICLVAPQVPLFLKYFGDHCSFDGVLRVHFAGGLFPQDRMDVVHRLFPRAKVFNNYGCTEAMPRLTIRHEAESDAANNVGKPLAQICMRTDESGRIFFLSPYAAVGFYDKDGFSAVNDGAWMASGDFGDEDGCGYWHIRGRADEVFKRYGEKISTLKLLETVHTHWKGDAVFYLEKDGNDQQGHVLVVSPKPTEEQYRAILNLFRKNHPRPHWPVRLESVDALPLLENGKVDKITLTAMEGKIVHWYQRIGQ